MFGGWCEPNSNTHNPIFEEERMSGLTHIREKLKKGELVIGTHVQLDSCIAAELFAEIGYDFIWIDWEHTALDRQNILAHIMAVKGRPTAAFVRVPWNVHYIVKPVLDMGVDGIVFPMIKTPEEARQAVASCEYPPVGRRGYGPIRANRLGLDDNLQYIETNASQSVWKIIQIESKEGVDNLEEILSVKGIDAIVIGTNDLAGTLGRLGRTDDPLVQEYLEKIAQVVGKSPVPLGLSTGYSGNVLKQWVKRGLQWVSMGSDISFMADGAANTLREVRALLENSSG
jgi:2-dehydro-3-deoxyglucarate aldolase/4-hydroxy-2-oxoheptanedioate aldolase